VTPTTNCATVITPAVSGILTYYPQTNHLAPPGPQVPGGAFFEPRTVAGCLTTPHRDGATKAPLSFLIICRASHYCDAGGGTNHGTVMP
jgi:hypothetical protein